MARIEKTVFIAYRRTNSPWALAIFQNLHSHGFDVFFDYEGIASGDFESVILGNIKARAHFLVLLTPSALERCNEPGDWLRLEIETALDARRNIVPVMLEGFDFATPAIAKWLTGKLAVLKSYNAIAIPAEYFMEAMERLREKFLSIPLDAVLHPSPSAARVAKLKAAVASKAPAVKFNSCFISFSTRDQDFADRLYADLESNGVRCWFAPHDMQGGRTVQEQIDRAILLHDRVLIILSEHSIQSNWVKTEIAKARKRELLEKRRVLFPIGLVDFERLRTWEYIDPDTGMDIALEIRGYFIPDFSQWKEKGRFYQEAFKKLVRDLEQTS